MRKSQQNTPRAEKALLPEAMSQQPFPSAVAGTKRWAEFLLLVSDTDNKCVHFGFYWL